MWWRGILVMGLLVAPMACDDDGVSPNSGTLKVVASKTGAGTDPDGFTIDLDSGSKTKNISVDGSATWKGVSTGNHTIELKGVASNCTVSGDNPRTVTVEKKKTKTETFSVACTS